MPKDKSVKKLSRKRAITAIHEQAEEEVALEQTMEKVVEVKSKAFACLSATCDVIITTSWRDALQHMQKCDQTLQKPKIKVSMAKAAAAASALPKVEVNLTDVTEEELVDVITQYYDSVTDRPAAKKHVLHRAIGPKYGQFPFERFGFGTFVEFSDRHGLEVYVKPPKKRKTEKSKSQKQEQNIVPGSSDDEDSASSSDESN